MTSSATSSQHFSEVRKTTENAAFDGFVCVKSSAVSKTSSNFLSEDIGNVFDLSGVAFRLAPPYGGILVFWLILSQ